MQFVIYLWGINKTSEPKRLGAESAAAVAAHVLGRDEVVTEFVEVESGRRADRPKLARALAYAKRAGAVLLIANLWRAVSRSWHWVCLRKTASCYTVWRRSQNRRAAQAVITYKRSSSRRAMGPNIIRGKLMEWVEKQGVRLDYIQPGKPQQNAYIARYNHTVRGE